MFLGHISTFKQKKTVMPSSQAMAQNIEKLIL
jgi:hypothetical protein